MIDGERMFALAVALRDMLYLHEATDASAKAAIITKAHTLVAFWEPILPKRKSLNPTERQTMNYPQSYHTACNHLVQFGGHRLAKLGRQRVAQALRDLRARFGREVAMNERRHMLFIAGHFPIKSESDA